MGRLLLEAIPSAGCSCLASQLQDVNISIHELCPMSLYTRAAVEQSVSTRASQIPIQKSYDLAVKSRRIGCEIDSVASAGMNIALERRSLGEEQILLPSFVKTRITLAPANDVVLASREEDWFVEGLGKHRRSSCASTTDECPYGGRLIDRLSVFDRRDVQGSFEEALHVSVDVAKPEITRCLSVASNIVDTGSEDCQ
jgi:hypothetical protein